MIFFPPPLGSSAISRYLSAIDGAYASMFGNENWSQLCESAASMDPIQSISEIQEIVGRIQRYLHTAGPCTQIPIAEAMVNYKDEDSCQIFVPFISVSVFYILHLTLNTIYPKIWNKNNVYG